jgi:hypothetical protein
MLVAQQQAGSSRARASSSSRFSTAAQLEACDAPWMHPSRPRLLPPQRAANAAAVTTLQRQQQQATQQQVSEPAVSDLADPLTGQVDEVCTAGYKWVAAYKFFFLSDSVTSPEASRR